MSKNPDKTFPLRKAAEAKLADALSSKDKTRSLEELVHELNVHQIELEMQNETLRQYQIELEKSRDRYVDFYECSPVGYLTLTNKGLIEGLNLASAALLGVERNKLLQRSLAHFVAAENIDVWHRHFRNVLTHDNTLTCELALQRGDGSRFDARMDSLRIKNDGEHSSARVVLTDITDAKHSAKQIQEQAELLERFFRYTHDCIVLLDKDFNFIRVNQAYADVCQRDVNEFPGHNHFELYPSTLIEDFRKAVSTGIPYQAFTRPFSFPDHPELGETYWDLSLVPIRDARGEMNLLLFTLKEVTDRRRTEIALIRTDRALRAFSACNSVLIRATNEAELLNGMCRLIVEIGGYCMAWIGYAEDDEQKTVKPQACFGHAVEYVNSARFSWADDEYGQEPTGTSIRTGKTIVVHSIKTAKCRSWCDQALSCGYSSSISLPLHDGEKTFGTLSIYSRESGVFRGEEVDLLESLVEDISFGITGLRSAAVYRHTADKLRASEERHWLVLDHAADAVLNVDPEGRFIYSNEQAQRMLGYSADELLGMGIPDITPPEEAEATMDIFELVKSLGHVRAEIKQTCRDGTVIPVEINTVRLPDGNYFGSFRDISERKRAEEEIAAYVRQLEESMQGTLQAVSNMVEQRDPYTAGHERRVGTIAGDIARELGWPDEKCIDLQLIGLVHDLGKISTPAEILSKPGRLSPIEYELVKGHVEKGYEILKDVKFPLPIAEIIRQHHERMDGSGYPRGLKGGEILLEARILAVADVIESMSSHRPYRPALGIEVALNEITGHRGSLYDEAVVDALLKLVREKGYQLPS